MKQLHGFTLIELVMFIVISGLLANTILLALSINTQTLPTLYQQMAAAQTAQKCMEWLIGQRQLHGYSALVCPSTTTPAFCTAPSGYTVNVNISCTTISGEADYKTLTVTVSGQGSATLTSQIADYE